jgi:hypothetical protein
MTTTAPGPRRRPRKRYVALAVVLAAAAYATYDVYGPRASDMRAFDPDEVARLETAMWRSYYGRERIRLFVQLTELLRTQYHLPFLRSTLQGYRAAHAAFVFKEGKERADYERALPDLVAFYADLRRTSTTPFDPNRAARLELEWWIVHRQRADHAPADLANSLADLAGEIYQLPPDRFAEHARLRAEAMEIRDTKADAGGVAEEDWARIDTLLHQSWRSLHLALGNQGPAHE